LFSYNVTGQVYAEPLYVSNLNMGALDTHNVVFVATENNDVYAFDAVNNGAGGGLLWHVNLGLAANVSNQDFGGRYGPYSDITPQVGITSTPVIDVATDTMYIDSFRDDGGGIYSHHIWALDITTGATKNAVQVAASIQGDNPADSVGGTITFVAKQQIQRSAVTLLNGVVYFAYAGYADTDPYHGWILGYDASNLNLVKVFNVTPSNSVNEDSHEGEGGIWQGGAGLASDGTHLYLITGNGDYDASVGDYGDTFLELTPDNSTQPTNKNGYGLSVVDNTTDTFTPYNEQTLADNDTDLGSGGAMLLPDQLGSHTHELVGGGKGGVIYLIDRDNFGGHHSSDNNQIVGTANMAHATSSAAYFDDTVFYHAFGDVLKAYNISNGTITPAPVATGSYSYAFPGATPAISSYGDSANGIVWEVQYSSSDAILRAYDAVPSGSSLTTLYSSPSGTIGAGTKFVVPTVADGRVYVGSSGKLTVFGLLSNPSSVPAAPTELSATAETVPNLQIELNWTDEANNENAFKIERSDNGGAFVQIGVASVNATTYADTNISSGHTYTYRVRATNPIGDSNYTDPASATIVATPPVYYYAFDDGSGTFASDSAGTNTGVLVGATKPQWVAGRLGSSALSFSGNGAYNQTNQSAVQVSSNLVNPLGGTSTFSAWVKTTQTGSNNHSQAPALTGVDQLGSTGDINWGTLNAAGDIGIYVGDSGGIYSTTPINDGQWHNVTMTRDAFTGVVQLYVDGTLNNTGSFDIGYKAAQFYLVGALTVRNSSGNVVGANYFNGQIDNVQIYNRVLSSTEISALGEPPSAPSGLSVSTVPDTGSMLQLSWSNTTDTAQSVQVERKIGADGIYEPIAALPGTVTSYVDTNLDAGTKYYYRVQATGSAGDSDYSSEASGIPPKAQILGHFVFYNTSHFDGQNGSSNVADGFALATDKQVLLPGQTASFQNYSSYSKGINGVMIDITNFDGSITPDDYVIRVGNSNDVSSWQLAPDPTFVTEYPGFGVNGSVRLELVWGNNTIQNEWVQVTLKADANTDLAQDDVFYFGNAIGDTGNSPTDTLVDGADVQGVHDNYTSAAIITNRFDFNRDKVVDATDEMIAQAQSSNPAPLQLISAPLTTGDGAVVLGSGTSNVLLDTNLVSNGIADAVESPTIFAPPIADAETPVATAVKATTIAPLLDPAAPVTRTIRMSAIDTAFSAMSMPGESRSLTSLLSALPKATEPLSGYPHAHHIGYSLVHDAGYFDEAHTGDELISNDFGLETSGALESIRRDRIRPA
ncbi:MAG TPA: LamG-like jellyroll fold domain-containing protein, partial [Lacipirellulaceae bacterium]|nr:LamG-like jellyroll fold domain-containing protein [Lacipirellulaceae bacterium]